MRKKIYSIYFYNGMRGAFSNFFKKQNNIFRIFLIFSKLVFFRIQIFIEFKMKNIPLKNI